MIFTVRFPLKRQKAATMLILAKKLEFCLFSFFFVLAVSTPVQLAAEGSATKEKIPAVFVFGDSIVDSGNNNDIRTFIKCNFPPYGRDFFGGQPTGRFSNGKVPSDFLASLLGVKELLPAYLDPNLELQDLLTGVSFASGGSGYDPLTPQVVSVLSLSSQIELFQDYKQKISSVVGEERASNLTSQSVYVVCVGSDDIANTYLSTQLRSSYDINSYTDLMVSEASSFLEELHRIGARKVAVLGLPPIGCLPSQRTIAGGMARGCSESGNEAARLFNAKLSSAIQVQNQLHLDSKLLYVNIYDPLVSLIQQPALYGFQEANRGCCGTGNIEVNVLCSRLYNAQTCPDASKFVFWDSYHPSEKAYQLLSTSVFNTNVHQLL